MLGPWGPAYFYFAFVLSCAFLLPVTPLMLSAGYIFGFPMGVGVTFLALCTSAGLSFLLARTLLREQAKRLLDEDERLRRAGLAVEREGFRIILLLRLSPLLPFAASNYVLGLTGVRFADFLLATAMGYAPWILALVYSSTVVRGLADEGVDAPWYAYLGGALLSAALLKLVADIVEAAIDDVSADGEDTTALGLGHAELLPPK